MTKEEKIAKLKELGAYEKWEESVIAENDADFRDYMLSRNLEWYSFICRSITWGLATDGFAYWSRIALS